LIGVIFSLGVWMKGVTALAFPGWGVIIATPLIFTAFLVAECVVVLLAAFLVRHLSGQVVLWMIKV
jgi:hypothetical protein